MDGIGQEGIGQEGKTNNTTKGAIMGIDIEKRNQIKEALVILEKVLSDMSWEQTGGVKTDDHTELLKVVLKHEAHWISKLESPEMTQINETLDLIKAAAYLKYRNMVSCPLSVK